MSDDLAFFRGALIALPLSLALWGLIAFAVLGCATDPELAAAWRGYDRAVEMGLATPRTERPYARLCDSPWSRARCVEISR